MGIFDKLSNLFGKKKETPAQPVKTAETPKPVEPVKTVETPKPVEPKPVQPPVKKEPVEVDIPFPSYDFPRMMTIGEVDYGADDASLLNLNEPEGFDGCALRDNVVFKQENDKFYAYTENGVKLGYVDSYIEDELPDVISGNHPFRAKIFRRDPEKKKIGVELAIYLPLNKNNSFVAPVLYTYKEDLVTGEKRYDTLSGMSVNDVVFLRPIDDQPHLFIVDEYDQEIGELDYPATKQAYEACYHGNPYPLFCKIETLQKNEEDVSKTEASIRIYRL